MRRVLVALLAVAAFAAFAAPAQAAPQTDGNHITRWDAVYDLQPNGSANVSITIDFDFGNDPGHGPYFVFAVRQGYDADYLREYPISDVEATSPSGAPANVYLEDGEDWLVVKIGDADVDDVSGTQTYVLTFTQRGVVNAVTDAYLPDSTAPTSADEFYWNVIGDGWDIPIADITVTVTAPADAVAAQCFVGTYGLNDPCDAADAAGARVTFAQAALHPGEGLTADVLYPSGTFDTAPLLVPASELERALKPHPALGAVALLLLGGGLAALLVALRRATRDEYYAGVVPGLTAPDGATTWRHRDRAPVAVRFEPPHGARPGLIGTLWDEKADARDVTATIVDLAVRGYLRVDRIADDDFTLVKLKKAEQTSLEAYERTLYNGLFEGRKSVKLSELRATFAKTLAETSVDMYAATVARGWYSRSPESSRLQWGCLGGALLGLGIVGFFVGAAVMGGWVLAAPFVVVGVAMLVTLRAAPIRRAEGSRVLAESKGFELFLRTADANQLRFEEGQDMFSRYLPYAIAFGITEQWTARFQELAAQGHPVAEPTWMTGYGTGAFWATAGGFSGAVGQFSTLASAAVAAPTPGSSGSSGFSGGGGGGFSGGGGGGGGGGGW